MAKQYGIVKVDFITYTSGGDGFEVDQTIDVSGLSNISDSGITVTGTISGVSGIFSENLFVNGSGTFNDLIVNNDATIGGDLTVSGNINASGVTISGITGLFASGTEAAPSISFVGDSNTGFYNAAANEVRITTDGNDRVTVDSAGNVGIGTTAPSGTFHVNQQFGVLNSYLTSSDNSSANIYFGDQTSATEGRIAFDNFNDGNNFRFYTGGSERLRIDKDGNVGIGTTDPVGSLNVQGTGAAPSLTYDTANLVNFDQGGVQLALGIDANAPFGCFLQGRDNANRERSLLLNPVAGNVGIGTTDPGARLDVVNGNARIRTGAKSGSNAYLRLQSTDASNSMELAFSNSTNASWSIQSVENGVDQRDLLLNPSGGKVGIGTTTPDYRFQVTNQNFADICIEATADNTSSRVGRLIYSFSDGAGAAVIGVRPDGQTAADTALSLRAGGVTNSDEVMRILSDGNVGIGTNSPATSLDIGTTDAVKVPVGTTAERPGTPAAGMFRFNDTTDKFEGYDGTQWGDIGGGVEEAPTDGQQYARQNAAWSVVQGGGGGVTYNGASAWGDVAADGTLQNGLNIASVTRVNTGRFDVVFTTPMPNADYAITGSIDGTGSGGTTRRTFMPGDKTANGFRVFITAGANGSFSDKEFSFAVHSQNALPPSGTTGTDAWADVAFDSTLLASYNVANIVKNGTGSYTVVFTTPMPTANYSVTTSVAGGPSDAQSAVITVINKTTTSFDVTTRNTSTSGANTNADRSFSVAVNATNANLPYTFTKEQIEAAINNTGVYAWANTAGDGTINGGNGLTCTRASRGEYTYTFNTPLPDANYAAVAQFNSDTGRFFARAESLTTTGFVVQINGQDGATDDEPHSVVVTAAKGQPLQLGGGADAWANVAANGTLGNNFNIQTATKVSTGIYELTFDAPMPNDGYGIQVSTDASGVFNATYSITDASTFRINTFNNAGVATDSPFSVAVFATDGNAGGFWGRTNDGILSPANSNDDVSLTGTGSIKLPVGTEAERPGTPAAGMLRFNEDADEFEGYDGTQWGAIGGSGGGGSVTYNGASAWANVSSNGTLNNGLNCTVTQISTGLYEVTFVTPMPSDDYAITFGTTEATANPYVTVIAEESGTRTVNGFRYNTQISSSTAATQPVDRPASFAVHSQNALPPAGTTGTDAWGTCQDDGTLTASYNIASVTRISAGTYDVVFTTPMPTANYAGVASVNNPNSGQSRTAYVESRTTTGCRIRTKNGSAFADYEFSFTVNATNANLPYTFTKEQIEAAVNNTGAYAWASTAADGTIEGGNGLTCTNTGAGEYRYTFNTPLPDTNYAVSSIVINNINYAVSVSQRTADYFDITIFQRDSSGSKANNDHSVTVTAAKGQPLSLGGGADAWAAVASDGTLEQGFNIASVTRTGTGLYDVVFNTPMPTANYAAVFSTVDGGIGGPIQNRTVNGFTVKTQGSPGGNISPIDTDFSVAVFATDGNAGGFWARSNDGVLTAANSTDDVQIASLNSGQLAGFRNQIINGDFRIWQRGTSGSGVGYASADRWRNTGNSPTSTRIIISNSDASAGVPFTYAAQIESGAGAFAGLRQAIELPAPSRPGPYQIGSEWTLSFYANSQNVSDFTIGTFRFADDSNGTNETEPNTTDALVKLEDLGSNWSRYSLKVTISQVPSGGNICLNFTLNSKSDGSALQYTGVQFEPGPVATPFEHRPIGTELALCQRYLFSLPADLKVNGYGDSSSGMRYSYPFPVTMRATPTKNANPTATGTNLQSFAIVPRNASHMDIAAVAITTGVISASSTGSALLDAEL